jgi:hypothetical protein
MYIPKENLYIRKDGTKMTENMKEYRDELQKQLYEATARFEEAKKEAAEKILSLTWNTAETCGAGYAASIEKITIEGAKMRALGITISDFDYFAAQEEKEEANKALGITAETGHCYKVTVNFGGESVDPESLPTAVTEDFMVMTCSASQAKKQVENYLKAGGFENYEIKDAEFMTTVKR